MRRQTFFAGLKPYTGKMFTSAMLWPGSRVRSSNQPSLGPGTALSMYERAGCEVRRSMSCGRRWEQNGQARGMGGDNGRSMLERESQGERAKKVTGLEAK